MFDLGTQELIVIFIVAFLVFGPKRLPELGRTIGKGIRDLKTAMRGVKDTFEEAGSDVTEGLKEARSDLEDSVYKSIEPHINKEKKKEEDISEEDNKIPMSDEGESKGEEEKETDKDG
jgi:TatA/E family protein of Tat protein translocase